MRYEVERLSGVVEIVEADGFHVQEIGGVTSVLGGKSGGVAHYVFRKDPVERYGSGVNVAAYTDVRTVRLVVEKPASVEAPSEEEAPATGTAETVN
jgi:hypothetical protein